MIFEAEPQQIEALDSKELVQLMKRLMLAESRLAHVPLRATHVPFQITVPDGGEDGRVEWEGGTDSTLFFPRRFCLFQSKAQRLANASLRSEILKETTSAALRKTTKKDALGGKRSSTKSVTAKLALSRAISDVLKKRGAYTVFCSRALTGEKRSEAKKAIAAAIREGGGDPETIIIEVLDANGITDWVNRHPSVALWLAAHSRRRSLAGFQTHAGWGKSIEIRTSPWVDGATARFVGVNVTLAADDGPKNTNWTFDQAANAVLDWLETGQHCVRIAGPSGFGKTRFAFEVFNRPTTVAGEVDNAGIIYADYTAVGDEVAKLAMEIADTGSASILIVDECPDQLHIKLAGIAQRADANLRAVTIDVETRVVQSSETLAIRLEPASGELISEIVKGVNSEIDDAGIRLIQDLARGFPQMAVLAAQQKASGQKTILSAEQYVERLLWGKRQPNPDAYKALSVLSLFSWVGIDGRVSDQAHHIAEKLAGMTGDAFVEHVKSFKARGIGAQRGDFMQVQPIPLAARLAADRLSLLPDGKLATFFLDAPGELKGSLLRRIRWLDMQPEAKGFARRILAPDIMGNLGTLNTRFGSETLDRLVHLDPDHAMSVIDSVFGKLSIDELQTVVEGRRYLVWALEKLAFRSATFERAARLLRRLGAAETEDKIGNNASGEFTGLFQLYLSGTEAGPDERLRILDEGLRSSNAKERALCVEALGHMLDTGHYSRSGGAEEIGSGDPLKDWQPKTYGEIRDFLRAAIDRLTVIAISDDPLADHAASLLGRHIRGLLGNFGPKDIKALINTIVSHRGFWHEAVQQINQWLYFDSKEAPPEIKAEVRSYFDTLLPSDPVDLAMMYCAGWHIDFHDPDSVYSDEDRRPDHDYAGRKLLACADAIAVDATAISRVIDLFPASDAKSPYGFARRLGELVADPVSLFERAVEKVERSHDEPNLSFLGGLISGVDARDPELAGACVRAALHSPKLRPNAISMIGAGKLQPDDLKLVVSLLESGDIQPSQCAALSYGRGLDHLTTEQLEPLLDALMQHGAVGLWTALDVIFMYLFQNVPPDARMGDKIKQILLTEQLFISVNRHTMDGHHLEQAVVLLSKHKMLNPRFVRNLTGRILGIADTKDSNLFFALNGPVRKILRTLIALYPNDVWAVAAPLLLATDPLRRFRLQRLLKPSSRDDEFGGGPLFDLPAASYLNWIRAAPDERAHLVAQWLPVSTKNPDGSPAWHPAIISFIDEFGTKSSVLAEISRRTHPSSWWGSLAPHLELWLPLFQQFLHHPLTEVRSWAQRQLDHLREVIAAERKRDDEDPVRFD